MKLNEILNRKIESKVLRDDEEAYVVESVIGNRRIKFEASIDDEYEDEWTVVFWQTDINGNGMKFAATGAGSELEVFSMVKDSLLEFVEKRRPKKINFSAAKHKGEESRSKLYDRLIKKFKLPNYKYEQERGNTEDFFYLVREGMMKRSDPYISGEKSGPRPPDVGHAPRPTTSHRSKLETLVKKSGKSYEKVEAAWNKAAKEVPDGVAKWAKVMLRVKADLGISV